ncbi:MAG TPA: hypothetical protein DDY32_09695 [Desulfobulbaceae bacterium]|nr:hypothetical protein [Desulfobulbaceae bacterium]
MAPRSVLIVDDEEIFLTITSEMVKKFGLPAMLARDGLEAVEIFKRHGTEIVCVLLDLQMPRMNGIDAFRHIRKLDEKMPVIITSGYLTDTNLGLLQPLNPAGYLKKPVSFEDLFAFLGRVTAG